MKINKIRLYLADIYVGEEVDKKDYPEKPNIGAADRFFKTVGHKIYDSALVLKVANNKYIDLADIHGAIDYLLLSTAAKLKFGNIFLLSSGHGENIKHGRSYVKNLRPAYPGFGKISIYKAMKDADHIRAEDDCTWEETERDF